jgi:23S rRNA pseudouridine1911/1915/1917 synthase
MILAEDEHRIYLLKPAGVPVFPPHADPAGDCVYTRLCAARPERAAGWPAGFEGGIAHRLDNPTSGLLVIAKTPRDLEMLRAEFASHTLRKFYLFRSSSIVGFREIVRTDPIAHHPNRKDRMVPQRHPKIPHRGRWYDAWTRFTARGEGWWQAEIRTGVTHQIRVHALAAGIPLDNDPIYRPQTPEDPLPSDAPRLTLHHACIVAVGWRSPVAPLSGGPDVVVRP